MPQKELWLKSRKITPEKMRLARLALAEIRDGEETLNAIKHHPTKTGYIGKNVLVAAYHAMVESGEMAADADVLTKIRMKPVRTLSGVTTVTVLTKPYPCPGKCIFCPDDVRMPKSYLPDEPGAMRGLHHRFDPYAQVASRLEALQAVGHPTDKIELLILGGTWSSYRRDYQEWFVTRCFDALNGVKADERKTPPDEKKKNTVQQGFLTDAQRMNESARHRNVGLVVETRPDEITRDELAWLRYLGVTKVQMGAQSLDDEILALNKRGHTVADLRRAMSLLRAGGFKIVLHWMPNLLGATPEADKEDFSRLWDGIAPDEIKIYPTQLLEQTELYEAWQRGDYQPYSTETLIQLLADVKPSIPHYCRVNRIIRDIPSQNVVEGNKRTSLRQDVHLEMKKRGTKCTCLRCREVRGKKVDVATLALDDLVYSAGNRKKGGSEEHFISFVTPEDQVAGFLRLSLPDSDTSQTGMAELNGAAIIREVHVYGQSLEVGAEKRGSAQHAGLGTRLLEYAEQVALGRGFGRIAVIAAVGTREYYLRRGFTRGAYYLVKQIQ